MGIVWFILIGLAAGFLAGWLTKGSGFGWVGNLVVGVVGAFISGYIIFPLLGLKTEGLIGSLIAATIGAVVLLLILGFISKRK